VIPDHRPTVKREQIPRQAESKHLAMKTHPLISVLCSVALVILCRTAPADAGAIVSLVPAGDGLFSINGIGIEGATTLDISIAYDPATVANLQVFPDKLISGALMTVNARDPGLLRISILRDMPIRGTGDIARITFERKGPAQGAITGLTVRMTDLRGAPVPVQTQFLNSSDSPMASGQPWSDTMNPVSEGTPTAAAGIPGMLPFATSVTSTGPAETAAPVKEAPPPVPPEPARPRPGPPGTKSTALARKGSEPAAETATQAKKVVVAEKSVLERFEEHKGLRTPQSLIALFEQDPLLGCRQEPSPVLADGRSTVKLSFIARTDLRAAPDIAAINASIVSIERDRDNTNTWIATVKPHRGTIDARMIISLPDKTLVVPLTAAPKIALPSDAAGAMTETDFESYLRGAGGKSSPGRDLNGDGIINHIDYYIATANYLAGRQQAAGMAAPGR
jgi:hypothetical protein